MSKTIDTKPAKTADYLDEPLAEMSDEELIRRYRDESNRLAFDELVHRYERELFSYLRRYLGDAALAEDTFQSTFLQVHLKCDQFDDRRRFRPWLYRIATNQAIDAQRRNKRHRMVSLDRSQSYDGQDDVGTLLDLFASEDAGPSENLESSEQKEWVRDALEELPEQLQTAVTLIYFQGLKYREAADVLDIPVGTVKSRLHTAILKLNKMRLRDRPIGND
jgi:RNA polymerase sigma-70 factor (ECF subfamily)